MKLNKGSATLLANADGFVTLELTDEDAAQTFIKVTFTANQFVSALSRLGNTPCDVEVYAIERIGKKHEHQAWEFEMPQVSEILSRDTAQQTAISLATAYCPDGWTPDLYFNSQGSFFSRDGKNYARTIIRRWV